LFFSVIGKVIIPSHSMLCPENDFRRESGCLNGWCVFILPKSDRLRTLHFALVSS
jgi:hypothetical protein